MTRRNTTILSAPATAEFAALRQQVLGLDTDYRDLKKAFAALDSKIDTAFDSLNSKLDERGRTPWAVIIAGLGFVLLFVTTVGGLAYAPVWAEQTRAREERIRADVSRVDGDRRIADRLERLRSDFDRLDGRVSAGLR